MILVQLELFFSCLRVRSIDPIPEQEYQYNDDDKSLLELQEYKIALKISCVRESLQKCLPKFTLKDKSNSCSTLSYSGKRSIERDFCCFSDKTRSQIWVN